MWTCRSARITPSLQFDHALRARPARSRACRRSCRWRAPAASMPSEIASVNASSTWLCRPRRTQHAHRGQHPPPRADDHHRFFGRVKAVLVERLHRRQLAARAEQDFDVLVGQMQVPGGDADDQLRACRPLPAAPAACSQHDLADDLFDRRLDRECAELMMVVASLCSSRLASLRGLLPVVGRRGHVQLRRRPPRACSRQSSSISSSTTR